MRLAWFSPFPPVRTGIAGRSADLVSGLRRRGHEVDPYPEAAAHDFVWRQRRHPYDLIVYQFGNSSHHDYEWAYALNHPGLAVLHDTRLHHARAAFLLREKRAGHYRAELAWSQPDVSPDAAEVAIAGFDSRLYYEWPMVRSLVCASRLTAVHGEGTRRELIEALASSIEPAGRMPERIAAIRLGMGTALHPDRERAARAGVRAQHGIAPDAVLFGCFGGLTPEKRVPQILRAFRALLPHAPGARLLLAGARAAHYDVAADVAAQGLADCTTLAGYLDSDEDVARYIAACDVTLNLRWPTARETSGPWLEALAGGRATVVTDLVHHANVPSLDPRTWTLALPMSDGRWTMDDERGKRPSETGDRPPRPVCVAIDILDEDHSLRLAMRRLASDAALRDELGRAGRAWWRREHSVEGMIDDYERVMRVAAGRQPPTVELPTHMRNPGDRALRAWLAPFGLESPL